MPVMIGVREGVQEVIKSGDTAAVFWRARKLSVDAGWILGIGIGWKLLLEDDGVLPAIAEIIGVDHLGANPLEYSGEARSALAFCTRHSHERVRRFRPPEAPLADTEFVHVTVLPAHCDLQHVMQLRQSQRRGNKHISTGDALSDLAMARWLPSTAIVCPYALLVAKGFHT